jgi:pantothenate synthetase
MRELDFLPDYFEVCRTDTLESLAVFSPDNKAVVCIAYHTGAVRLIDNCSYPVLS